MKKNTIFTVIFAVVIVAFFIVTIHFGGIALCEAEGKELNTFNLNGAYTVVAAFEVMAFTFIFGWIVTRK
jgi:hypothetical protein